MTRVPICAQDAPGLDSRAWTLVGSPELTAKANLPAAPFATPRLSAPAPGHLWQTLRRGQRPGQLRRMDDPRSGMPTDVTHTASKWTVTLAHVRGLMAIVVVSAMATLSACTSPTKPTTASTSTSEATTSTTEAAGDVNGTEIDQLPTVPGPTTTPAAPDLSTAAGQTTFLRQVFADIQSVWSKDFAAAEITYIPARLILFQSQVSTACGVESANVGPFYCSGDRTVYLDMQFFTSLERSFGVTGDFAEAYVVAHEMGHHIQNLVGITSRVAATTPANPSVSNALSVRVELQADCLAGVWAHSTYERNLLEPGDIDEALNAAQTVGDDFLAHASGITVDPDSWTHGSSAQRQQWFTTGYNEGHASACDTFGNP
jgi:predicted metalloprotease